MKPKMMNGIERKINLGAIIVMAFLLGTLVSLGQVYSVKIQDVDKAMWDTLTQVDKDHYWDKANFWIKYGVTSQYDKLKTFEGSNGIIPIKRIKVKPKKGTIEYYMEPGWKLINSHKIGNEERRSYSFGSGIFHHITIRNGKIIKTNTSSY